MDILTRKILWNVPGSPLSCSSRYPFFVKVFLRNPPFLQFQNFNSQRPRDGLSDPSQLLQSSQKVVELSWDEDADRYQSSARSSGAICIVRMSQFQHFLTLGASKALIPLFS